MLFNEDFPIKNLTFEDVKFNNPGMKPWEDDYFKCENVVNGVAKGTTWPVPKCLKITSKTRQLPTNLPANS
jgi:hypothetical protein